MRTFHILLLPVFIFGAPLRSEETDSSSAGGIGWFAYPCVFCTPETDRAFGGGAVRSMKFSDLPESRRSSLTFCGFYSIIDQFDPTPVPEVYLDHDRLLIIAMYRSTQDRLAVRRPILHYGERILQFLR